MQTRLPPMILIACLLSLPAAASDIPLETEEQKTIYALGLALSQRLLTLDMTADDLAVLKAGLDDGVLGAEPRVDLPTYGPKIDGLAQARQASMAQKERNRGSEYRERVALETGVLKTDSGMLYMEKAAGSGAQPGATDTVSLEYVGSFISGEEFDSSARAGGPAVFQLDQVKPCFAEGLQRMRIGGKARVVCPPELVYADAGFPPLIPPGATLVFDFELLGIVAPEAEPTAAAAPPVP